MSYKIVWFYYKIPVHRERNADHYYPSELITENSPNFIFCSHDFVILLHFITYHLLVTYFVMHVVSHLVTHHPLLYHIKFFPEFSPYYILLFLISSYRLLKKGFTSPHSIFHFAGSSHCKCINTCWRGPFHQEIGMAPVWPGGVYKHRAELWLMLSPSKAI